jgi:heptosyltransferase-2
MKILVRAPNWIGDQILAYPFYSHLRKTYPHAHITVACVGWVKDIQFLGFIDQVIPLDKPLADDFYSKFTAVRSSAKRLRDSGPWDLGFTLPNSFGSALFLKLAGCKKRVGYDTESRSLLLSDRMAWQRGETLHRAQAYLELLGPEFRDVAAVDYWGVPPETELDSYEPGSERRFDWATHWPTSERIEPPNEPFWVLAPGATADSRRWATSSFATLARTIATRTGMPGLILGGPKESPLAAELVEDRTLKLKDYVGVVGIPGLAKILEKAQFVVCNESGFAHLSALCGAFTQVVCGAADPKRTRPLGPGRVQVTVNPIACWPCEKNTCELEPAANKLSCLRGIQPETIQGEITRGLRLEQSRHT